MRGLEFLCEGTRENPRVMIVSPHPDDEVIGAGARLPLLRDAMVVQVTDGAPDDPADALRAGCPERAAYADLRKRELRAALALCGNHETIELGVPDQKAAFDLSGLTRKLERVIADYAPDYILTVPYEGGHPDHDATAFAVHHACASSIGAPQIIEMLSYHNDGGRCDTERFLNEGEGTLTRVLTGAEVDLKRRLMSCFASQRHVLQWFPVRVEKFRFAPTYDFARPPHPGQLYYEMFPWGMESGQWCALAKDAMSADLVAA